MKMLSMCVMAAVLVITLIGMPLTKGGEEFNTRRKTLDAIHSMRVHNFDATSVNQPR